MVDIDKSKFDRRRYFACLSMLILELLEVAEEPVILGSNVRDILEKYKVDLFADKKRCRVNLEIPASLNKKEIIDSLQKSLLVNSREYAKQLRNYRNIVKYNLKKENKNG